LNLAFGTYTVIGEVVHDLYGENIASQIHSKSVLVS